jgi:hypothetical protein
VLPSDLTVLRRDLAPYLALLLHLAPLSSRLPVIFPALLRHLAALPGRLPALISALLRHHSLLLAPLLRRVAPFPAALASRLSVIASALLRRFSVVQPGGQEAQIERYPRTPEAPRLLPAAAVPAVVVIRVEIVMGVSLNPVAVPRVVEDENDIAIMMYVPVRCISRWNVHGVNTRPFGVVAVHDAAGRRKRHPDASSEDQGDEP